MVLSAYSGREAEADCDALVNDNYLGRSQTIRKWLPADAIPTQAKLMNLADWLAVSAEWLRFGTGKRRAAKIGEQLPANEVGVVVVGKQQAALVPVVELLAKLSPQNVQLVENIVRCVLASQENG